MAKQIDILCSEITLYNAWIIVKEKGAAGGIDGITILEFEKDKRKQIAKLVEELTNKTWKPYPYLEIEIAKDKSPEEKRKLGMTAIRDKIVQLAIKTIIEPRYDRIFVGNSYGYRPGKGATKAIRRVLQECKNKKYKYVLRLDIDNFFDSIDHFLLRRKLVATGTEEEIVRLIMQRKKEFRKLAAETSGLLVDRYSIPEHVQKALQTCRQERGLGKHLSALHRMLCPNRVHPSCQEEGTSENRRSIASVAIRSLTY